MNPTQVIQHYVIKLSVTFGRSVVFSGYSGFLHDITEILLKVALNTINLHPTTITQIAFLTHLNLQNIKKTTKLNNKIKANGNVAYVLA